MVASQLPRDFCMLEGLLADSCAWLILRHSQQSMDFSYLTQSQLLLL